MNSEVISRPDSSYLIGHIRNVHEYLDVTLASKGYKLINSHKVSPAALSCIVRNMQCTSVCNISGRKLQRDFYTISKFKLFLFRDGFSNTNKSCCTTVVSVAKQELPPLVSLVRFPHPRGSLTPQGLRS